MIIQNLFNNFHINPSTPIFIGGEGRSGTTLMRVMLNCHRNIACGPETHCFTDIKLKELHEHIISTYSPRIAEFDSTPESKVNKMFSSMIRSFFEDYAKTQGKKRWADKTPHNIKSIDFYLRIFNEDLKFIHMVRDGRDVTSSLLEMNWGPTTVQEAALAWKEIIDNSRRHIGKNYFLEIKYEDLVADPKGILVEVCDFLGEKFDDEMLDYNKKKLESGSRESSSKQVGKPIYSSSIGRWERDLNESQVEDFMKIAGETLIELGYK